MTIVLNVLRLFNAITCIYSVYVSYSRIVTVEMLENKDTDSSQLNWSWGMKLMILVISLISIIHIPIMVDTNSYITLESGKQVYNFN
jgi:hypothetical protein